MLFQPLRFILIFLIIDLSNQTSESLSSNLSHCAELDEYYKVNTRSVIPLHGQLRHLYEKSRAHQVEVWGGRGATRAAAALLYVIIRYGLRYHTELIEKEADICEIISRNWSASAVVAPAAHWPRTGCNRTSPHVDRFAKLSRPAVKTELQLYVYLAPAYRNSCKHLQNLSSFADLNTTKKCNLATPIITGDQKMKCKNCIVILASKEYDTDVIQKYVKDLHLEISYYESDLKLRTGMKKLRENKTSFVFIYDYLWSDVDGTHELESFKRSYDRQKETEISFLIGDGTLTAYYAPDIYRVIIDNSFAPDTNTLREILDTEENNSNLTEAACYWANKSRERFESLMKMKNIKEDTVYNIVLLDCNRQLINNIVRTKIDDTINKNVTKFRLNFKICNGFTKCNNITQLDECLQTISLIQSTPAAVLSGWSGDVIPVVDAAEMNGVFLAFASPVPYKEGLKTCRSAAGNIVELATAYRKFFEMSNWYRISIISEATESAHSFTESLKFSKKFILKDETLKKTFNDENIHDTLIELKNLDARIFVLNSEWNLSNRILCVAIKLEMTSSKYVWITRDRDVLKCDDELLVDNMKHISIGLEWRGGKTPNNFSLFSREEWIHNFQEINTNTRQTASDDEWDNFRIPSKVLSVAKTVKRVWKSFTTFSNNNFEQIYNLHGISAVSLLASYFDDTSSINESTIFIDEWWGNRRRSIAILWQVENENISDTLRNTIDGFLKIRDRAKCILKSGDPFAPRCHDLAVFLSIVIILFLVMSLLITRRLRLARKNMILLNAVMDHRNKVASSLDQYLVERHLVKVLHEIGSGCFGRVHFAELSRPGTNTVVVAAKEPHNDAAFEEEREFLHEATILSLLNHNHIVRLIGICIKDGPPMVLMEHALYLDLRRYLIERRHLALSISCPAANRKSYNDISDESLTRFVRQAAAALEYLASSRLVHRDVRAANCLIDRERSLKLADFGMARRLYGSDCEYASNRRALFPVLYMAPESLNEGLFSPASDVWALGVLILEIVTLGARPFGNWPTTRVVRHVSLGGHAPLPPDASIHTHNLAVSCWKRDPEERPSASKIKNYLTNNPQALSAALLSPNPLIEN